MLILLFDGALSINHICQRQASLSELSMRPREFLLRQRAAALRGAASACWL